jgi:predicted 2-oxoglutarate/Fe(II)-dependent dioxygenase YbiX
MENSFQLKNANMHTILGGHIHCIDDFISESDAQELCNFFDENYSWYSGCPWLPPISQYNNGPIELVGEFAKEVSYRKSQIGHNQTHPLMKTYGEAMTQKASALYGRTLVHRLEPYMKKFVPGSDHSPHADCEMMNDGIVNFMPGYSPSELNTPVLIEAAANLYLNDDFDGGELFFPNLDITIKPKARQLVIFPGGHEYVHGVKTVNSGFRYVLFSPLTSPQRLLLHMHAFNLQKELEKVRGV